jgi:hypothetical protein
MPLPGTIDVTLGAPGGPATPVPVTANVYAAPPALLAMATAPRSIPIRIGVNAIENVVDWPGASELRAGCEKTENPTPCTETGFKPLNMSVFDPEFVIEKLR